MFILFQIALNKRKILPPYLLGILGLHGLAMSTPWSVEHDQDSVFEPTNEILIDNYRDSYIYHIWR
jgi:hypothetical protein